MHLLPSNIVGKWKDKVRLGEQGFFERRWTHVEEVVVFNREITFRFNPNTQIPGPFDVKVEYREQNTHPPKIWQDKIERLNGALRVRPPNAIWGEIRLYLDDALAFSDIVLLEDIPF